jgi:hypothetical protein
MMGLNWCWRRRRQEGLYLLTRARSEIRMICYIPAVTLTQGI